MTHLDRDDRQMMLHNYRQLAEILSLFRRELRAAGLPRLLTSVLVLRQFDHMTRQMSAMNIIHLIPPDFLGEEP